MPRLKRWQTAIIALVMAVLVLSAALLGGGWHFSSVLKSSGLMPKYDDPAPDLVVLAVGDGRVTLGITAETKMDGDWMKNGTLGLEAGNGYNQVGAILELAGGHVVRELTTLSEQPTVGEMVRLDSYAFPEDPEVAHGIPFEEVHYFVPTRRLSRVVC